jgi:dolichyl-phosphate-mannose-protein mannosyltransferase
MDRRLLLGPMIEKGRSVLGAGRPHVAAGALLVAMLVLMLASLRDDVITADERDHIGSGYSYLVRADFRMNREHPPLMKDLAALPLLFMHLRVPWDHPSWGAGDEWGFGGAFIYGSGRSPDKITRAARTPMILFTLGLGWVIYWWTTRRFGSGAALLALFFFTFSPTFLAHGRLVTTDVGAAAGIVVGTICYVRALKHPTVPNLSLAGLAFGLAFLAKFSTLLLVPATVILTVLWVSARPPGEGVRLLLRRLVLGGGVLLVASLVIYVVYLHHTWNFPKRSAEVGVSRTSMDAVTAFMLDTRVLRPWGYYLVGLQDDVNRARSVASPFFRERLVESSTVAYFPLLYLIKEPLSLHVLTLVALLFAPWWPRRPVVRGGWLDTHFTACALVVMWALYWGVAMLASLQIGVRHMLPTFPFVYVLVGAGIVAIEARLTTPRAVWSFRIAVALLLAWQAATVLRVNPSYIAYFNEIAGGPDGGAEWATDSNLDWGQDLRRLVKFMNARGIDEIQLNYFGSAEVDEYLGGRYRAIQRCSEPQPGWVAVSAFWYQSSRGRPECDYRRWLTNERLVTKIGYSIFVFHVVD